MSGFTPAKTGFSRVFLIEGRARPDHEPEFQACMKAGSPDRSFGDVTPIECPDPDAYGEYIEIGSVQGAKGRATIDLIGKYAADVASTLLRLADRRCAVDVQVHEGACTNPSAFDQFTKAIIFEEARLTNWSADELGSLESGEGASINETSPVSAKHLYEVLRLTFSERCPDIITHEVLDVIIYDIRSCGECDSESDGCERIYAVTDTAVGSPGTGPDVIYSLDKGVTCNSDEITTLDPGEEGTALAGLGKYIVVVSYDEANLHYKEQSEIDAGNFGGWTEVAGEIAAAGPPNDIWSTGTYAFIVGDAGYVYGTDDPIAGAVILDAGMATGQDLNAVHAISDEFAVAVGNDNAVVFTESQDTWSPVTGPAAGVALTSVWVKNKNHWFVGTTEAPARLFYTLDQGNTWVEIVLPGAALYTAIEDIAFATDSVGYVAGTHAGPRGRILRTYDGGYDYLVLPEEAHKVMPAGDAFNALAACKYDANFVVAVGLADAGAAGDGIMVIGED